MPTVLFLCSGNYYRSRFAEIFFNWLAPQQGLNWRAESRGSGGVRATSARSHATRSLDYKPEGLPYRSPTAFRRWSNRKTSTRSTWSSPSKKRSIAKMLERFPHWADRSNTGTSTIWISPSRTRRW